MFILDKMFASLPTPPFAHDEKKAVAADVYTHIWQQAASSAFAKEADHSKDVTCRGRAANLFIVLILLLR